MDCATPGKSLPEEVDLATLKETLIGRLRASSVEDVEELQEWGVHFLEMIEEAKKSCSTAASSTFLKKTRARTVDSRPRVLLREWEAPDKAPGTATEVLLLALLLCAEEERSNSHPLPLDSWSRAVLLDQGAAYDAAPTAWAVPSSAEWNPQGLLLQTVARCLCRDHRAVQSIAHVIASGRFDGSTAGTIPMSSIDSWIKRCAGSNPRRGPSRGKTPGTKRHIGLIVLAARLLKHQRKELIAAYREGLAACASDAAEMTKSVMASLLTELQSEHVIEMSNMNETLRSLEELVDASTARVSQEKKLRYQAVERSKKARTTVDTRWKERVRDMRDAWRESAIEEVEVAHGSAMLRLKELKAQAHAAKRQALAAAEKAEKICEKRTEKLSETKALAETLQERIDELEEALSEAATDAVEKVSQIRELKTVGTNSGRGHWWPWWVRAMIMEQLINGTPPTAIPANIASDAAYLVPFMKVVVPTVDMCRKMRGELRIVSEVLAAYRIAKCANWRQLFTDGTSRRQTSLLTAIIGIDGPDGELIPIILRGAFISSGDTAEQQVEDIIERAIHRGAVKLTNLKSTFERLFPNVPHDIPDCSAMNIAKLGEGGMVSSDNCNTAMKVKRLMTEKVKEAVKAQYSDEAWAALSDEERAAKQLVLEGDCWNHLRNVWLGETSSALTIRLRDTLREEVDKIDSRLRVDTAMEALLRAVDKEFSLCANYPKGHGDMFRDWVALHHPRALLFHVARAAGSRQDLAFEGAGPVYMNRAIWVEFLDERLRVPGAQNILQECLFIILTSVEMIASMRIHCVIYLAIVLPTRWLAGKTHLLSQYNWSERSMGRVVDILEKKMEAVLDDGDGKTPGGLMLDQTFMMCMFDELVSELPPFKDYLMYMYDTKRMALAGSSITEHQYARLRDEVFSPTDEDNADSKETAIELAAVAAQTILTEIRDPKKATSRHLSSTGGTLSWGCTTEIEHEASKRKMAVNDPAESTFSAATRELQVFGRISLGNTSGVAMARRNKDFFRAGTQSETRKSSKNAPQGSKAELEEASGIFHSLSIEMKEALLTMAANTLRAENAQEQADLKAQRAARRRKEEIAAEQGREKASENYIDALYYYEMWGSDACWRTVDAAIAEMSKLKNKSAQLAALKEQIRIRVLGLGWSDLACAWSKDGVPYSPAELLTHLKMIINEQTKRNIPNKPPVPGLARKELPSLGKRTADVAALDSKELSSNAALEAQARATKAQREAKGIGDSYQARQGSRPELDERIIGKRIEVVFPYKVPDGVFGDAMMWCSGEIVGLDPRPYASYPKGKSALVRWDANDRVEPPEPVSESGCKLLPTMWNKDGVGAWRFDLDPPLGDYPHFYRKHGRFLTKIFVIFLILIRNLFPL